MVQLRALSRPWTENVRHAFGHPLSTLLVGRLLRDTVTPDHDNGAMATALDPYGALGVSPTATQAEIDKAYRRRQLLLHPDRTASRSKVEQETAAEMLRDVLAAYAVIGNPRLRALHDAQRRGRNATAAPPHSQRPMWPATAPPPQPADGPVNSVPAPSANGGGAAPDASGAMPSQTAGNDRSRRDSPSAVRLLAVLGAGLFVVGPIADEIATHFLPFSSYNLRWVAGFATTLAFIVVTLRRTTRGHSSGYSLPTTRPTGARGSSVRDRIDDNYVPEPPCTNRKGGRISASEYGRRAEREMCIPAIPDTRSGPKRTP